MLDFAVLAAARLIAAWTSPIPDCDEVYNFWEPTHFVTHGRGLQTWEWSPVYAIRSWAYVGAHAGILRVGLALGLRGASLFFFLRCVFALVESWTEACLVRVLRRRYPDAAPIYVALSAAATGLFHASVAYLPSTFAMYAVTLAVALFLQDPAGNIVPALSSIGVGGLLGWPFVLVLALPLGLYYSACVSPRAWLRAAGRTVAVVGAVLGTIVLIDSLLYRRLAVVPFNIVSYNVLFASEGAGPEVFGTEPWTYYFLNLALNFNAMFPLALIAPLFTEARASAALSTLYVWLGILLAQPHKEERFIFPVYPVIVLGAAFTLSRVWRAIRTFLSVPRVLAMLVVAGICALSVLRSAALARYYTAPLEVYKGVPENATVCVGREWYRFPSSYFFDGQIKFIDSGYDGLLPGEFESFAAVPPGMNNQGLKDPGKLVPLSACDYVVDITLPANAELGETDFAAAPEWRRDVCRPFLDTDASTGLARLLYLGVDGPFPVGRAAWLDYCRYRRVRGNDDDDVDDDGVKN